MTENTALKMTFFSLSEAVRNLRAVNSWDQPEEGGQQQQLAKMAATHPATAAGKLPAAQLHHLNPDQVNT